MTKDYDHYDSLLGKLLFFDRQVIFRMSDIRHSLRKLGFPLCAKEGLQVTSQITSGGHVSKKSLELAHEIIQEFVFLEKVTEKDLIKSTLNSLQELQLLDLLCDFFGHSNSTTRNTLFLCLFPTGDHRRNSILEKLVAMAVATKTTQVLTAAGVWLQQCGCNKLCAVNFAKSIVNDYLVLLPDAFEQLHDLPDLAPEFTANLLAAMTECYSFTGPYTQDRTQNMALIIAVKESTPPNALLNLIAYWAGKSPDLCTNALTASHSHTTMPFIGLVRWCVLEPLIDCNFNNQEAYSRLHLAIMESILLSSKNSLVDADILAGLADLMRKQVADVPSMSVKKSIDRFIQITIVLLRTGKVAGNLGELRQKIDTLPPNDLLDCFRGCRILTMSPP